MAIRKYLYKACDRCGDEVELLDNGNPGGWVNVGFPATDWGGCAGPQFDLCPDCRRALLEWFKQPKEERDTATRLRLVK